MFIHTCGLKRRESLCPIDNAEVIVRFCILRIDFNPALVPFLSFFQRGVLLFRRPGTRGVIGHRSHGSQRERIGGVLFQYPFEFLLSRFMVLLVVRRICARDPLNHVRSSQIELGVLIRRIQPDGLFEVLHRLGVMIVLIRRYAPVHLVTRLKFGARRSQQQHASAQRER